LGFEHFKNILLPKSSIFLFNLELLEVVVPAVKFLEDLQFLRSEILIDDKTV
jgi:hypothetical protein